VELQFLKIAHVWVVEGGFAKEGFMKRSTYLVWALSMALSAGVLLAVTFSRVPVAGVPRGVYAAAGVPAGPAPLTVPLTTTAAATLAGALPTEPGTHDPVLIKQDDWYYLFYTGGTVNSLRSKDLIHWTPPTTPTTPITTAATTTATAGGAGAATAAAAAGGRGGRGGRGGNGPRAVSALPGMPNSIRAVLPNVRELWAPDISFFKGKYMMYFAAIGLATNKTLDPGSKDYMWHDEGVIVRSQNSDNYNAIDPNFCLDEKGQPWLVFGSFWTGIKLRKLTDEGKPDPADTKLYALATRDRGTAIEAPFIIHEGKYFYLFVSWDKCCAGLNSTYRIMVGRSEKITGPYVDKENVDMAKGGGTQLLAGDGKRIIGPGHCGLFKDGDHWLMVHHFYDGNTPNGTSRLQVRPVTFDEKSWPVVGKSINSPA
jgi:arabinan endo-1,5-alpha-L-arabinosidase